MSTTAITLIAAGLLVAFAATPAAAYEAKTRTVAKPGTSATATTTAKPRERQAVPPKHALHERAEHRRAQRDDQTGEHDDDRD